MRYNSCTGGIILAAINIPTISQPDLLHRVRSHVVFRALLVLAGTLALGLAVVGIFVPLLPTTPFLLLAAACYASSSPSFYRWLMNNRWFGRYLRNYREGRGLTLGTKVVSVLSLWLTIGFSGFFLVTALLGRLALLTIAVCVTAHLLTRPTYRPE